MIERIRLRNLINAAMFVTGDKCKLPNTNKCRYKLNYLVIDYSQNDYSFRIDCIDRKTNKLCGSLYNIFSNKRGDKTNYV